MRLWRMLSTKAYKRRKVAEKQRNSQKPQRLDCFLRIAFIKQQGKACLSKHAALLLHRSLIPVRQSRRHRNRVLCNIVLVGVRRFWTERGLPPQHHGGDRVRLQPQLHHSGEEAGSAAARSSMPLSSCATPTRSARASAAMHPAIASPRALIFAKRCRNRS